MKKELMTLAFIGMLSMSHAIEYDKMVDERDGKTYKTVVIKNDNLSITVWMAENLAYNAKGSEFLKGYGRYYDATTAASVCPEGWTLPDFIVYNHLAINVGLIKCDDNDECFLVDDQTEGTKSLKSKKNWLFGNNGTNSSGFNALPGGGGVGEGEFQNVGMVAAFWTSDKENGERGIFMINENNLAQNHVSDMYFPVRCVKTWTMQRKDHWK